MKRSAEASAVLTIRIGADLAHSLSREARRRHTTKSELVREILASGLAGEDGLSTLAQEARRQSLLVAERPSEGEALGFLEHVGDPRGWE
jgi:hypothetical protein